eukprot:285057_1
MTEHQQTLLVLLILLLLCVVNYAITCHIENAVVNNYDINDNLVNKGWTRCYLEPYSTTVSINTLLSLCLTGTDYYLFVGALATSSSVTAYVGAMAPSYVLTGYTSSKTVAFKPEPFVTENPLYNVSWYNFPTHSFGFAPTNNIDINIQGCCGNGCSYCTPCCSNCPIYSGCLDTFTGMDSYAISNNQRLSWRADQMWPGGRAGSFILRPQGDTAWHKVVYYKHCPPTVAPTTASISPTKHPSITPTSLTTNPTPTPTNNPSKTPTMNPTTPSNKPTKYPSISPTVSTVNPSNNPSQPPTINPTYLPSTPPTKYPTKSPTKEPIEPYVSGQFPGYTLFVRGFNIFKASTSGNAILDINYPNINIESWTNEGAECSYASLEFSTSFTTYAKYAETDSQSIAIGFSVPFLGGSGGSLSRERSETRSFSASAQSLIYTMNLRCKSGEASVTSYDHIHFSGNFIKNLKTLPRSFDENNTNDLEKYIDFWDTFGTHLIKTAELGGLIRGAITVDKCVVERTYSDSSVYKACLNGVYKGIETEDCYSSHSSSTASNSATNAIINKQISVSGGDNSQFTNVINEFGDKENDFQNWISDLGISPDIVGGNLDEIHDVIQQAVAIGSHNLNDPLNERLDDNEWLQIALALKNTYEMYSKMLSDQDGFVNTQCVVDCGEGTLDKDICVCSQCDSISKCCGLIADGSNSMLNVNKDFICIIISVCFYLL